MMLNRQHAWLTALIALAVATIFTSGSSAVEGAQKDDQIHLTAGRSAVVSAPWPVSQVSLAEPGIADVQVVTPDQVVVVAKKVGATDLVLWGENGQTMRKVVRVTIDVSGMQADFNRFFPTADLSVSQSQDVVTVSGMFRRAEEVKQMRAFMEQAGIKYVDMTSLAGVQQVMIKVRVAEASRQVLRVLGINGFVAGNEGFFGGSTIGGNTNSINIGVPSGADAATGLPFLFNSATSVGSATSVFFGVPAGDVEFFISALEDNQYLRTLAEPSLVALSGEEASFLAGGEFPIPVVQGSAGVDSGTSITIEFKEFGVRLKFRPTVMGDGTIQLKLAPEVSSLSDVGALIIDGFRVPSLSVRRSETTLEMKSGQTFALAGLIDQQTRAQSQITPYLGRVPMLGSLFRSVRYQQMDTELIVLATVELVEPLNITSRRPVPGDLHSAPNDWELYMLGLIESRTPAPVEPVAIHSIAEQGLHRLRGPGAWASNHERNPLATRDVEATASTTADEEIAPETTSPAAEEASADADEAASAEIEPVESETVIDKPIESEDIESTQP